MTPSPAIHMTGAYKSFKNLAALCGMDLVVPTGEKLALMGPSGCGKSTLLRCLSALEAIDKGRLVVNGVDLTSRKENMNRFRASVGLVFQQFNLFPHLTILENLVLGPIKVKGISRDVAVETALKLLERVEIRDKADVFPDHLSGGQKQRAAIARSLAMNPDLLLFDEPTSALDPIMTQEVLTMIEETAQQGLTILIVTHELAFARRFADRVVFMHHGRMEEEGPPDVIFGNPQKDLTRHFLASMRD